MVMVLSLFMLLACFRFRFFKFFKFFKIFKFFKFFFTFCFGSGSVQVMCWF